MRIRTTRIVNNTGGRCGCQFQSPFTNQVYYASLEHGQIVLRDYGQIERGREQTYVTLTPLTLSACFATRERVCVTLAGFPAGTDNSGVDTYLIDMTEA